MFSTKDFNTIVLLKLHGYTWVRTERDHRGSKWVYLDDTKELQELLLDYDNGALFCDMKKLFSTIEEIKEFVHR